MTRTVRINRDRLWASLMELKDIGAYDDEATGLRGARRLALTDAGADIGIVEGVQSISWQRLTIRGEAAHAGTTPIESRYDASLVAVVCSTAMVFVAGENGGISHTPREYSNSDAHGNGTDVLANAVLRLADQP